MKKFLRVLILVRHFGPLAVALPLWAIPACRVWLGERVAHTLEACGATFIKLGQIMSSRPDLVAPEIINALMRLQDRAPEHDVATTRRIIAAAFGQDAARLFKQIDDHPIASGSIAQVHAAHLADGRKVAVKVRHPDLEKTVGMDVEIIEAVVALAGRMPGAQWLDMPGSARNFGDTVRGQLNLVNEAEHLKRFRANFAHKPNVRFPEPIEGLVASDVLVESFEEGVPMSKILSSDYPDKPEIARLGLDIFLQMIARDGFVHADMHPGNILGRWEDGKPVAVVLDCGMVAELKEKDRRNYVNFFVAVSQFDGRNAAQQMIDNAPRHDCREPDVFKGALEAIFEQVRHLPISEIEAAKVLGQIMQLVRKHRIQMESAFTSVNVGMMVLEGVGRQLDPNLNLLNTAGPIFMGYVLEAQARALEQQAAAA